MANSSLSVFQGIGNTCTWYTGAIVGLVVPGPGTIVVSAVVRLGLDHAFGARDAMEVVIASAMADCTFDSYASVAVIPANLPADTYPETVPILKSFSVGSAGTSNFYINAIMTSGAGGFDGLTAATMVAVFYPA